MRLRRLSGKRNEETRMAYFLDGLRDLIAWNAVFSFPAFPFSHYLLRRIGKNPDRLTWLSYVIREAGIT